MSLLSLNHCFFTYLVEAASSQYIFNKQNTMFFPGVFWVLVSRDCSLKRGNLLSFENEEGRKWDHVIDLLSRAAVGRLRERGKQSTDISEFIPILS